jgi:hypothetical protein
MGIALMWVFEEKLREIPNRRIRGRRDNGARRHLTRIHGCPPNLQH